MVKGTSTSSAGKKKRVKPTLSDALNQQFDIPSSSSHDPAQDLDEGPIVESYGWEPEDGDEDAFKADRKAAGRKHARTDSLDGGSKRLRRRGPLDESLSSGQYAGTAVSVEAAMDDLFGGLDMADIDDEAGEMIDDDDDDDFDLEEGGDDDDEAEPEGRARRKQRRVSELSEEDYVAYLEKKSKKRQPGASSGLSREGPVHEGVEDELLGQLDDMRSQHIQLLKKETAAPGDEKHRQQMKDTVLQYTMMYSQLLRLRVRLQPAVLRGIQLPQYYSKSLFTDKKDQKGPLHGEGEEVQSEIEGTRRQIAKAYKNVVTLLHEILEELLPSRKSSGSLSFSTLSAFHQQVRRKADECLGFWGSRLAPAPTTVSGSPLQSIHQPIVSQIRAILQSKERLRIRVQKNRSHLSIFAHPSHVDTSEMGRAARASSIAEGDVDPEIFCDADFMRELVRRGGGEAVRLGEQLREEQEKLLPPSAMRIGSRKGFNQQTKGKALNFTPRPKLTGFMVPQPWEEARSEVVVKSLFQ